MRLLLILLVALLTLSTVFDWDPGPAPGVKLKNAILYAMALGMLLRVSLDRNLKIELPAIPITFVALILYAILSYVAIVAVIQYPYYRVLDNALQLKGVIDQLFFFLVFFYGTRSNEDAILILKCLLIAFALSHVMAVADALGFVSFGDIEQRSDGRVQGLVGESNQYGAFVAMSLPALVAIVLATSGLERLLWTGAAIITAITLVMTVSRGAFVATFAASAAAVLLFRRYAPPGRLAMVACTAVLVGVVIVCATMAFGFGDLLYERLVSSASGDMGSTSSGRTDTWRSALQMMFEQPISLLTGFGWRAWWSMPFRFSPHNHYLNHWFNLGLIGLASSILLFVLPIRTARKALVTALGAARPILMGFVVSTIAIAAATFFVDLYLPWLYYWAFAGVAMRLAANAMQRAPMTVETSVAAAHPPAITDPFGWKAPATSREQHGKVPYKSETFGWIRS
jgi:O-antigen ligase